MVGSDDRYERAAITELERHGVDFEELSAADATSRFPQIHFEDVNWALYEPEVGYLLARRACQAVKNAVVESGGRYVERPAKMGADGVVLSDGETVTADAYVFACGPWLRELFPEIGANGLRPSRQEIYYFGTPSTDRRYDEGECPIWIDNGERLYYGIPGTEWRGFKIADDAHGPEVDPTTMERVPDAAGIEKARDYLSFRFPGLVDAPLVDARVCQYTNTPDGHFIIDRHPERREVWIVGGGSGHGFKHGPALGEHVAANVLEESAVEPMFALARFDASGA